MYLSSQVKSCMALLVFFILVNMKCPLFANLINLDGYSEVPPNILLRNASDYGSKMHMAFYVDYKCISEVVF